MARGALVGFMVAFMALALTAQELSRPSVKVADLHVGTLQLPSDWTQRRTGTKDSEMGEITRADGLIVNYDIGFLAGTHMHAQRRAECLWYREQMIHGHLARIGLIK